jgi:hypothetical protein
MTQNQIIEINRKYVLHVRLKYISFVENATPENIASGVHSVKYFSISHENKQLYILYVYTIRVFIFI